MTQPPKEKSLVVEALIFQRDGYFPESPLYEELDKAIRIAEIEHKLASLTTACVNGGFTGESWIEMNALLAEYREATHD
jgi:hypothetical protein